MKTTRYICLSLLMTFLLSDSFARDIIPISGKVMDIQSGDPVPYYPVTMLTDSGYSYTYITDDSGYFRDTLFTGGLVVSSLTFFLTDCEMMVHDTLVTDLSVPVYVEFSICVDSAQPECHAYFEYYTSPASQMEVSFLDLSFGTYTDRFWDFGDSTSSTEIDPVHTYEQPGNYYVCLTIFSNDSLNPCFDTFCQLITVDSLFPCAAGFTFQLDSVSSFPNLYYFTDLSEGNIDSWYWDFGDGTFSEEQNPVHQFPDSGSYQVCLSVMNLANPNICMDMTCQQLITPHYFNLGGLVYIDDYPINNPEPLGDTAIASLYRVTPNELVPSGTMEFSDYGYFWFTNVVEGDYLIKVSLTQGSTHFDDYFTTYYQDQILWEQASILNLYHGDDFDASIALRPFASFEAGEGRITGYVYLEEAHHFTGSEMEEVSVILMDGEGNPLSRRIPDENGAFEFDALPLQSYRLVADMTGMKSNLVVVTLDQGSILASNVQILLSPGEVFGVNEYDGAGPAALSLFPNPVRDILHVDLTAFNKNTLCLEIMDITGRTVYSSFFSDNLVSIAAGTLSSGLYLLRILSPDGIILASTKFIR